VNSLQSWLRRKTRNRAFLWKLCLGTIAIGMLLAWLLQDLPIGDKQTSLASRIEIDRLLDFDQSPDPQGYLAPESDYLFKTWETLIMESPDYDTYTFIEDLNFAMEYLLPVDLIQGEAFFKRQLSTPDAEKILLYLKALGGLDADAELKLKTIAESKPTPQYANLLLGMLLSDRARYNAAFHFFKEEGRFEDAEYARNYAVNNRLYLKDYDSLVQLTEDPSYADAFNAWTRADLAFHQHHWLETLKWILISQTTTIPPSMFILATLGMLVWATILLKLCRQKDFQIAPLGLCALGLILGILSTTLTLFWLYVEDAYLPFKEGTNIVQGLAYYIATVGLREETCKLLLFLPALPFLLKRGREIEYLLVASFVGLGFAYEENFSYLQESMGTAVAGRLLTANFLHITTTGLSGLFLCRALDRHFRGGWNDFFTAFGLIIIAHGAYDALLSYPILGDDFSFLAIIVFVVLSRHYFREAHALRLRGEPAISLTATLMLGLCLIVSLLLIHLSIQLNFTAAFAMTITSFISGAIILFMFIREFDERI